MLQMSFLFPLSSSSHLPPLYLCLLHRYSTRANSIQRVITDYYLSKYGFFYTHQHKPALFLLSIFLLSLPLSANSSIHIYRIPHLELLWLIKRPMCSASQTYYFSSSTSCRKPLPHPLHFLCFHIPSLSSFVLSLTGLPTSVCHSVSRPHIQKQAATF